MMQAQVLSSVVYRVVKQIGKPSEYKDKKTYAFDLAYTGDGSVAVSAVHPCNWRESKFLTTNGGIRWFSTDESYICYNGGTEYSNDRLMISENLIKRLARYTLYKHKLLQQNLASIAQHEHDLSWDAEYEHNLSLDAQYEHDIPWGTPSLLKRYAPNGIAPSKSGATLVCLWNHAMGDKSHGMVLKIDRYDSIVLKIESDKNRKLFTCPTYVTENGNEDICVSDVGAVVVTDGGGMFRFRYKGDPGDPHFDPYGICCDSRCNIIMADMKNNKIHTIDQDGDFLYYIQYGGMKMPRALCIDENDNLYVGEWNLESIKVLSRD